MVSEEARGSIDIYMFVCHIVHMKKKMTMFRTTVYLPANVHRAMKIMAAVNGKSMAVLLREALVQVYKDDLADLRAANAALAEMKKHPETAVEARAYFAKRR